MRRAKIVCTLGPRRRRPRCVELVEAGMDVARLNLSHGAYDEHQAALPAGARGQRRAAGRAVGVLVDLQGPKIRLGRFADGPVDLVDGAGSRITDPRRARATHDRVSTTYKRPAAGRPRRRRILVDDGKVTSAGRRDDRGPGRGCTRVEVGGPVSNNKGLNLPGVRDERARRCPTRTRPTCAGRCTCGPT